VFGLWRSKCEKRRRNGFGGGTKTFIVAQKREGWGEVAKEGVNAIQKNLGGEQGRGYPITTTALVIEKFVREKP